MNLRNNLGQNNQKNVYKEKIRMTVNDTIQAKIASHQAEIDKLKAELVTFEKWINLEVTEAKTAVEAFAVKLGSYL